MPLIEVPDDHVMANTHETQSSEPNRPPMPDAVRVKNRRRRYLELHPEYFSAINLESADPLLYDRLIRRFQSASERQAENQKQGYAQTLENQLVRSEAKLAAVNASSSSSSASPRDDVVYIREANGSITMLEADADERVTTLEQGWAKWKHLMGARFVRGEDDEFEYADVDDDEDLDDIVEEERVRAEEWFDDEEARFVGDERTGPEGETGVLDY
ncbi:Hypothetical protein R9X50_00613500 [Acrodontium crateriforme]|uniref:CCD97-like C-terminal domain-containing protein n=1 Tax=Acrodontium crateriforme TaxID=150365 RepID=A0AAQ3M9G6_9PEZI|nr:Hypothetical protein R9X50_00613500 [Acrodontium crateriforme]